MNACTINDYSPSHPWFYKLGGKPISLKNIRHQVIQSQYQGYLADDIAKLHKMPEPNRSNRLLGMREECLAELRRDIQIYRRLRRELAHQIRNNTHNHDSTICTDIDVSLSLKYSHLSNHFAHLNALDKRKVIVQYSLF